MEIYVKDYSNVWEDVDKFNWKVGKCYVKLKNESKPKKYKVYFDIFNNKIFMKPYLKYCEFEFEHLFHFKLSCQDYNQNRIIFI